MGLIRLFSSCGECIYGDPDGGDGWTLCATRYGFTFPLLAATVDAGAGGDIARYP